MSAHTAKDFQVRLQYSLSACIITSELHSSQIANVLPYNSKFGLATFNLRPTGCIQLLILRPIEPVQGVTTPLTARIPALLDQITFSLFESDTGGHPGRAVRWRSAELCEMATFGRLTFR